MSGREYLDQLTSTRVDSAIMRLYSMSTAGTALTGSLAETRMQPGGASITLATGLTIGPNVLRVVWAGRILADAGATTFTTRLRLGNDATPANNAAVMTQGPTDTAGTEVFAGSAEFSFFGPVDAAQSMQGALQQTLFANAPAALLVPTTLITTVSSLTTLNLDFTGQWSAADANSAVLDVFNVYLVRV